MSGATDQKFEEIMKRRSEVRAKLSDAQAEAAKHAAELAKIEKEMFDHNASKATELLCW